MASTRCRLVSECSIQFQLNVDLCQDAWHTLTRSFWTWINAQKIHFSFSIGSLAFLAQPAHSFKKCNNFAAFRLYKEVERGVEVDNVCVDVCHTFWHGSNGVLTCVRVSDTAPTQCWSVLDILTRVQTVLKLCQGALFLSIVIELLLSESSKQLYSGLSPWGCRLLLQSTLSYVT